MYIPDETNFVLFRYLDYWFLPYVYCTRTYRNVMYINICLSLIDFYALHIFKFNLLEQNYYSLKMNFMIATQSINSVLITRKLGGNAFNKHLYNM